ncbi:BRCT domain-containing protein [Aurantimonas sp. 22II-16-19i]|uniref:BRCT domain-containing protein n=1 Tax=Aurantimonas sp. 22II-16-19i TaxID=1317114 RepID=UPI0009F7E909|nr:BRCT domain-containing protein [Aurantimonas sp. 22II-16-19i]ORE97767.1 superfamily I DNA and RNA helicases and helicasesubunits-like protein [Aurantimonas sp. 22II-16-19i]
MVLVDRIRLDSELLQDERVRKLNDAALGAISSGGVGQADSRYLCDRVACLVGDSFVDMGLATYGSVGAIEGVVRDARRIVFRRRTFVVTGKLSLGSRTAVAEMIKERGGHLSAAVATTTDYLVVGVAASRDWVQSSEGRKIQRALELRREGRGPEILQEVVLRKAMEFGTLLVDA